MKDRYRKLYAQCKERKLNVQDYSDSFEGIPEYFFGTYQETPRDREILLKRFSERGHQLRKVENA